MATVVSEFKLVGIMKAFVTVSLLLLVCLVQSNGNLINRPQNGMRQFEHFRRLCNDSLEDVAGTDLTILSRTKRGHRKQISGGCERSM